MPIDKSIDYSAITPEIKALTKLCLADNVIEPEMYVKYAVNRGLRDLNGNGVLTGLTEISEIQSSKMVDGEKVPCEGKLFYRGVDVEQIVSGFIREKRYGFEETVYLLLFGALPDEAQLDDFKKLLAGYRSLPTNFVRDVILKAPNADMMNTLARSVLTLYSYDARATDNSTENVLRQCLQLIALFPMLSVYGYQAYSHYVLDKSLFIHNPVPELSTAENLLHMEAFDRAGLIYGMGHAVYSLSDPRANVFKHFVEMLSEEKGRHEEYALYAAVARLAPKVIGEERKIYKGVSANIDFYSGFVYSMLDLPLELYTPIFAISRIAGWSAHRIEELINAGKIIRPAYKSVKPRVDYVPLHDRK